MLESHDSDITGRISEASLPDADPSPIQESHLLVENLGRLISRRCVAKFIVDTPNLEAHPGRLSFEPYPRSGQAGLYG